MSTTNPSQKFSRTFRILGMLMIVAGVAGAALTYRSMRAENLTHAKTGIIALDLSGTDTTQLIERFHLYRSGQHRLFLTALDPVAEGSEDSVISAEKDRFNGRVNIQVTEPGGKILSDALISREGTEIWRPRGAGWVVLDTINVADPTELPWTITARVAAGDSNFSTVQSEVFILPPQPYEIGSFLSTRIYTLVAMGGLVLFGFIVLVAAGSKSKLPRNTISTKR